MHRQYGGKLRGCRKCSEEGDQCIYGFQRNRQCLRTGIKPYCRPIWYGLLLVNGDQPRNLLDLYSWGKILGLEIVAAGKASEYDFVWNPDTCEFIYMEGEEKPRENMPGSGSFGIMKDGRHLKGAVRFREIHGCHFGGSL